MRNPLELMVVALDGAVPSFILAMMAEGKLPAFRALAARGVFATDCRPPFPTITPTCWSSFATGAIPAIHGATCQDFHPPGKAAGEIVTAYHSGNITAERFWEAAARAGKRSLIMQLPASGPAKADGVFQVAGAGCAAIRSADPTRPTVPATVMLPGILADTGDEECHLSWIAETPASGQWQPADDSRTAVAGTTSRVTISAGGEGVEPFDWSFGVEDRAVVVRLGGGNPSESSRKADSIRVEAGSWSRPFQRTLKRSDGSALRCWFRVRLFHSDPSTSSLKLYITETAPPSEFASPADFAAILDTVAEVPANHGHAGLLRDLSTIDAYLEAERHNFEWQLEVLDRGLEHAEPAIAVLYSVYLDSMNHAFRNVIEGLTDPGAQARETIVGAYRAGYELADWFLGEVVKRTGKETSILVLSDHGSVGYTSLFDPLAALEGEGLIVRSESDGRAIDYSRSLVYPISTCHVYVNLAGREPGGLVEPDDYDLVVNRTIRALQSATNDDGVTPVAFAVRREEAGLVGLGGERTGDVVYGIRGSRVGGHIGGVHACQIPTARTETGDIRSLCLLAGPRFKEGVRYDGPVWLWDLAPTLAAAADMPIPQDATGRVVTQVFRAEAQVRE